MKAAIPALSVYDRHMTANVRLTLPDDLTARLDAVRGPATRTAYAMWIIEQALEEPQPAVVADPSVRPPRADPARSSCKHEHVVKGICRECRTGGH